MCNVTQYCNVLLDKIVQEYNEILDKAFEDAGGEIESRDDLDTLRYKNIEEVILELPQIIRDEYNTLKGEPISSCTWDSDTPDGRGEPKDYHRYYTFRQNLETTLRSYLSQKHNVPVDVASKQ